jgi:hypothetical protein
LIYVSTYDDARSRASTLDNLYFISLILKYIFSQIITSPKLGYNSQSKALRIKELLYCLFCFTSLDWTLLDGWGYTPAPGTMLSGMGGMKKTDEVSLIPPPSPHIICT